MVHFLFQTRPIISAYIEEQPDHYYMLKNSSLNAVCVADSIPLLSGRILITGGGGFLGGALTTRLLDEGETVVTLDLRAADTLVSAAGDQLGERIDYQMAKILPYSRTLFGV